MSSRYPQPDNEVSFEKFCLAFLKSHWKNPTLELYAQRGQPQNGVDIFDPSYEKPFRAAQCKHHEQHQTASPSEIAAEVKKALEFKPALEHYAILTTAKALKQADDEVTKINREHRERGLFTVELIDWGKIEDLLDDYPEVADLLTPARNSQLKALTAEIRLGHGETTSRLEAVEAAVDRNAKDSEIDTAHSYLDSKNPQVASALFEKLRQRDWHELLPPQKYRVLSGLAQVRLVEGKDREAGKLLIIAKEAHPQSDRAQINEALGYEFLGDTATAHRIASELRTAYPSSGKLAACWLRTHPDKDTEELRKQVSVAALEDPEVWVALAVRAMQSDNAVQAETYARSALALKEAWVGPHILLGQACLQQQIRTTHVAPWTAQPPIAEAKLKEAIAAFDRAAELSREQQANHVLADTLVHRAIAKALLGSTDQADADFEEAIRLAPEDPHVLLRRAQFLRNQEDHDQAVKVLRKLVRITASVEAKHLLASVLNFRDKPGDQAEASAIFLEITHSLLGEPMPSLGLTDSIHIDEIIKYCFYVFVDSMIELHRIDDLDGFLGKLPEGRLSAVAISTARSKQAFGRGDIEESRHLSDEAVSALNGTTSRVDCRALAAHLMKLENYKAALPIWERICPLGDYSSDVRHLIRCAQWMDRQDVILQVARSIREAGIDDPWLIHHELNVLQASDVEQAISVLQEYLGRNPNDHASRLRLTTIGLELDRPELVDARPEVIPSVDEVTPVSGAMAASVLRKTGRPVDAVVYAYALYRKFSDDPLANMALFAAVFAVDSPPPDLPMPETIESGTAVLLAEEGRPETWYVVEDSTNPNRPLGEFPPDDPLVIELIGRRVGDTVTIGPSMARERTGVVREVVSKYVYRARYIAENWQVRFREYPWINVFHAKRQNPETGEEEIDLTDMKLVADRNFERRKEAEKKYSAREITIHIFAHLMGQKDFETSLHVATTLDLEVFCWDGPSDEWNQALSALRDGSEVVLDLSALATLYLLNEDGILRDWPGSITVSQNTVNQIRDCLPAPPGGDRAKGRFGRSEHGYHFAEIDPSAEEQYRNHLEAFLDLVSKKAAIRGCEALASLDPEKRQKFSTAFGQHALESLLLAARPGCILWTDDFFLGTAARSEFGVRRAWTQVAVEHGTVQGFLDADQVHGVGAKLLAFGYNTTRFHEHVLAKAASLSDWDPEKWPLSQALQQLSNPNLSAGDSGRLAVALIIKLFEAVAFPPSRQRLILAIAERFWKRADGLPLVGALARILPRIFGLNVVHSREVTEVLNAWLAEASRRVETSSTQLLIMPPEPTQRRN